MLYGQMKFADAVAKAEHLIAVGQTRVWVDDKDPALPWQKVDAIEAGGGYRLNGPTGVRLTVHEAGLELHWSLEFEGRDANGRGVSLFDRDRLRDVMMKLPRSTRVKLAAFFENDVLPELAKRTDELREALNKQNDSEDCVRGLIEFGRRQDAA